MTTLRHAALALPVIALAACASPTAYAPATGTGYGYGTQKLEERRFRINFSGNALTTRQTVETYLLYRAAEVTLQNGADYFVIVRRGIDPETHWYSRYDGPSWHGGRWSRDPFFWGPAWHDHSYDPVTRYDAHAEITIHSGRKPDDPLAFDAHDVVRNLASEIRMPGAPPG